MKRNVRSQLLTILALLICGVAYGQIRSSTITGIVTDASNAVVVGAKVTVTEQQTAISNSTVTSEAGFFTVPYLPAGSYTVSITAPGFADYKLTGLDIGTGQTIRSD